VGLLGLLLLVLKRSFGFISAALDRLTRREMSVASGGMPS